MRLKIIRLIIFVCFFAVAAHLFYVQVLKGGTFYRLSVNNRIRVVPLEGRRGLIKDRNGEILADNRLSLNVTVVPQDIQDKDRLFDYLAEVLKTEKKTLLRRFWQKRVAPFAPVAIAEDVDKRVAMVLEENAFRFPGLSIQEAYRRFYPFRETCAHVIGYVGRISRERMESLKDYGYSYLNVVGYSGVEEYYDRYLKGQEGGLQVEVNSLGQQVRLLSLREPEQGEDIELTIDVRIQKILEDVMDDRVGAAVIMGLNSGEILGLYSSPSFDPNFLVSGQSSREARKIMNDKRSPMLDRVISGLYPPGSVFKIAVAAAGLTSGKITPHTSFTCPGYYALGGRRFRCAHTHGTEDLIEGIAHSCNVYFFNAGLTVGSQIIRKYARQLGLESKTLIDLPSEEKGSVVDRLERRRRFDKPWFKGDTLNFSIGQGETLVTPLQLLRMMAIVGRNGRDVQPHLIKRIGPREIISAHGRIIRMKKEVFETVNRGLRSAVTDSSGTARMLDMEEFKVFGKTGTAQSAPGRDHHAWFVGYTQGGHNPIVFCVFLEYGGSSFHSVLAGRKILKRLSEEHLISGS